MDGKRRSLRRRTGLLLVLAVVLAAGLIWGLAAALGDSGSPAAAAART